MIVLKNVLVATDFSEAAATALAYGRDLARAYGAALHVIHVEDDLAARYSLDMSPMYLPDIQRDIEAAAKKQLDGLLSDEDRTQLRARGVVRTSPGAAAAIVDYANDQRIDLIVVGTHGRGAVSRFFVGSVAERVVRTAPCPVLTVRHPERDFIAPDAIVVAAKA